MYTLPFTILAIIALCISVGVSLHSAYRSRAQLKTIIESNGRVGSFIRLNGICVILSCLSAFANHISLVGQFCATQSIPLQITCSIYAGNYPAFATMIVISAVLNGALTMSMNFLVAARWKQMKQNVPYNNRLRLAINILGVVLFCWKISMQISSGVRNDGNLLVRYLVAASAALFSIGSIIFDLTVCALVAATVFKARVGVVQRSDEAGAAMKEELTRFKRSLVGLLLIDLLQIAITLALSGKPELVNDGIAIAVAAVVIHVYLSKELLADFVESLNVTSRSIPKSGPSLGSKKTKGDTSKLDVKGSGILATGMKTATSQVSKQSLSQQ